MREITKMPKFGTKFALIGYFWPKMPYLCILGLECSKNYYHIWNQHPQICLLSKFTRKTRMPKFQTKNALSGYFWTRIWKKYCHIWNQHFRICLIAKFCEIMQMPKFRTKILCEIMQMPKFQTKMLHLGCSGLEF